MPRLSKLSHLRRRQRAGKRITRRTLPRLVKQIVARQAEHKYIYNSETGTTVSNGAPFSECITLSAEGDDFFNREGIKFGIIGVEVNFYVTISAAQGLTQPIRLIVYRAKGDEFGALPTQSEVLDNSQAVAATTAAVLEPWALPGHEGEYRKLFDRVVMLGPAGGSQTAKVLRFKKSFKTPLPLKYDNTSAAIGSIVSGHVFILAKSTDAAGANAPVLHYMSRVTVVDY